MEGFAMSLRIVAEGLWEEIEPLFPGHEQSPEGGRKPIDNRTVFTLLVIRLKTCICWRDLPIEMGTSQCTVRRRLKEWIELGLFAAIVERLLTRLKRDGRLELAEVLIDNACRGGVRRGGLVLYDA
jgi:transposase